MPQKSQANTSFLTPEIINSAGEAMFNQFSFRKRLGPASLLVFAFSNNPGYDRKCVRKGGEVSRGREQAAYKSHSKSARLASGT